MSLPFSDLDFNDHPEALFDPHSEFGLFLKETVAAPGADPVDILIQLEDFVIEQLGDVVIRGHRATIQIRSK